MSRRVAAENRHHAGKTTEEVFMTTTSGYKVLRADGTSLNGKFRYALPTNGKPGPWQEVPGNGSYVAHTDGLYAGGAGPLLVRMRCRDECVASDPPLGVRCWRRVRVVRILPWSKLPACARGNMDLGSVTNLAGVTLPQSVGGNLYLGSVTNLAGVTLPQSVGGNLYLGRVTDLAGTTLPQSVGGYMDLGNVTDLAGTTLPQSVGGYLNLGSNLAVSTARERGYRAHLA